MSTLTSADGTRIAFSRTGNGPALILVDGAFGHRRFGPNESLAEELAERFTVYTYDRRGRGESSDTAPYAVQREYEDLKAVVAEAGGRPFVYGISSGAPLVLDAVNSGVQAGRVAVFEAPFVVDDTRTPIPSDAGQEIETLVASDRRGAAVKYFMTKGVGLPGPFVALMRIMPAWTKLKSVAHTVPYDMANLGDTGAGRPLDASRWSEVSVPTLVLDGGKSPAWMRNAMQALTAALPNAEHKTLPGQMHVVKAKALAPVLIDFFTR